MVERLSLAPDSFAAEILSYLVKVLIDPEGDWRTDAESLHMIEAPTDAMIRLNRRGPCARGVGNGLSAKRSSGPWLLPDAARTIFEQIAWGPSDHTRRGRAVVRRAAQASMKMGRASDLCAGAGGDIEFRA